MGEASTDGPYLSMSWTSEGPPARTVSLGTPNF